MKKSHIYYLFLILMFLGVSSCAQNPETYPNTWIDYPRDGDTFALGETVTVISHAFAKGGIAEVVLSINGEAYRRDAPVEGGQEFTSIQQDWVPSEAGTFILKVQTYDSQGLVGNPDSVSIEVKGDAPTQIPTLVYTETPVQATETLVFTETPVNTDTPVPTNTFPPPTYPPPTETFTAVPPTDTPPPDTTPPPVPTPSSPANGSVVGCAATQTLMWTAVTDPSGIAGYYVKLEREITTGNWQSAGGYGPVTGTQVDINIDCGIHYRWMVRAQDGVGNFSAWSAPSEFAVTME